MVCYKCGETEDEKFYPSTLKPRKGRKAKGAWCKVCHVQYSRERVLKDRAHFLKYQTRRRHKVLDQLCAIRVERGCQRCGENHPACLSFHHRDEKTKKFNISQEAVRRNRSLEYLQDEIAKCDVLCENCHRKLHSEEGSGPFGGVNRDRNRPKLSA